MTMNMTMNKPHRHKGFPTTDLIIKETPANEETLSVAETLREICFRNNVSSFARGRNLCRGNQMFFEKIEKHFLLLERKTCFRNK